MVAPKTQNVLDCGIGIGRTVVLESELNLQQILLEQETNL